MSEHFHYTASGLDYIYLANGFTRHETDYGPGTSIDDMDGLHDAIARHVVTSPTRLRGQEVRFLRSMLDVSQAGLARILGTKRLTVARWEAKPGTSIPGTADRALRLFFALKMEGDQAATGLLELLAEIDEAAYGAAVFEETNGDWHSRRAA
jgi:DNA-binding transcriptional regulator YiaG